MRKGDYNLGRKSVYYIIAIFVLVFIFFYMRSAIVDYNQIVAGDLSAIRAEVIAAEAVISPKCFAHYDAEIERAYPGVIDMNNFDTSRIGNGCMNFMETDYMIRIGEKMIGTEIDINANGVKKIFRPISIINDGKYSQGVLEVYVQG